MQITQKYLDDLTYSILGCAIEVHKQLGPGLIESVYEKCFIRGLSLRKINYSAQQRIPVTCKGMNLEAELRYDVLVENQVIVELKACDGLLPVHEAILLTYMRLLEKPKGILINFNCTNIFKEGQKTVVNQLYASLLKN